MPPARLGAGLEALILFDLKAIQQNGRERKERVGSVRTVSGARHALRNLLLSLGVRAEIDPETFDRLMVQATKEGGAVAVIHGVHLTIRSQSVY